MFFQLGVFQTPQTERLPAQISIHETGKKIKSFLMSWYNVKALWILWKTCG